MMNQQTQIQINQAAEKIILNWRKVKTLAEVNPQILASNFRVNGGACIACFEKTITEPIIKYFDYNLALVRCYTCQKINKS